MTERFLILGRAGSGKTVYVLKEFYRYIKKADTGKAIFLLPTHSQTEHLKDVIIRYGPARGFVDNSIFTFSQLSREILVDDKEFHGRIASELEKDALLKGILGRNPPQYLTKNSWDHRGLRHALLRFFKELKEDSLYPADFKARVGTFLNGARRNSPAARAKYEALTGVYDRFQGALEAEGLCDEDDVLNAALKRLEGDGSVMREKEVLIADGFHSFTPVEFRLLGLLAQRVPNIYITLVFDPEAKDSGSSIFDSCREVYGQLGAMGFKEIVLTGSERFASSKTLALVERNLFAGCPVIATTGTDDDLAVIEAVNIEDEVEQMARRIYKMVLDGPLRFCDIGIILRDVGPYYDLMETVFPRYGIPLRLYVKRPLDESPLVKTIMSLFRIFAAHWRDDTRVLEVIKSHYVKSPRNGSPSNGPGLPAQEVDRFEREALKRGLLTGRDGWLKLAGEGQWPGIQGFLGKMAELEKGVFDPKGAGAFKEWFLTVIDECITIPGATDPSCGELVKREARALRSFLSVLDSLPRILGDGRISFNNFVEELSGAVSASSCALKDKRQDVVNVIDALEARQWELPVVFVGGLLERQFPRQARENLFTSDRDRRQLNDLSGVNLKELLKNSAEEERFLFYIALTRARKRLVLSYPAMDSRGSPNISSFFLREVKKLFSAESFSNIFMKRIPSDIVPAAGDVVTRKDLRNFVCYYLNTPYRKGSDKETHHVLARTTYNDLRTEDTGLIEDLKVALGIPETGDIGEHRRVIREIFPSFRATQFSDFAQCPFLHFARHILRLKALMSLAEDGLSPLLQGDIIHETLRRYCEGKAADISNVFKGVFARKTRGLRLGLGELQARDAMLQALRSFVEKDRQYEDLLPLRPEYIEKSFGGNGEPALEIHDTQGMGPDTIRIRGRIDRVDVVEVDGERLGLVLDYKYVRYADGGLTKSKFKEIEEEGVDLQLPIYLMAAREFLNVTPIGAQLYTLKPPPERSGILESRVKQLAPSLTAKGTLFIEERDMEAFLEHSRDHIRRQVRGIMSGCKDILPRDVRRCEEGRCEFLDVCRFEKWSAGKKGK